MVPNIPPVDQKSLKCYAKQRTFWYIFGPLAQRLEQRTHNPLVVGSNPTWPTLSGIYNVLVVNPFFNAFCFYTGKKNVK